MADSSGRPLRLLQVCAAFAAAAVVVLWFLTMPNDGSGRLGDDDFQPKGSLLLALVLPVWYSAAGTIARPRDSGV